MLNVMPQLIILKLIFLVHSQDHRLALKIYGMLKQYIFSV